MLTRRACAAGGLASALLPRLLCAKPAPQPPRWPLWEAFARAFLSEEGGRVIDRSAGDGRTVSEGQAYALFFALVADDRAHFDVLLRWTEDNLCAGDLTAQLPAWLWGRADDGRWGVLDANPASDADLWLAYVLGEAGRLWRDRRYTALSQLVAERVLREEVADLPGLGPTLLPGPQGFKRPGPSWRLNPSYLPLHVLQWLSVRDAAWVPVRESSLHVLLESAPQGFAPDWTLYQPDRGFTPDTDASGLGSYNAIRVYLWAGLLHPQAPGRSALLTRLAPMARLVAARGVPPERIDAQSGQPGEAAPVGFSAALLPFLAAEGETAALRSQQARLLARPLRADAYYEQCLGLFGQGAVEGAYHLLADGRLQPRWSPA